MELSTICDVTLENVQQLPKQISFTAVSVNISGHMGHWGRVYSTGNETEVMIGITRGKELRNAQGR